MTQDFANRGQSAKKSSSRGQAKIVSSNTYAQQEKRWFPWPSFSGRDLRAIVVLLAAYLPEWINTEPKGTPRLRRAHRIMQGTFEFPDYLKTVKFR